MRFYSFSIVTYHTDIDIITSFCKNCTRYAFIFHDKDANKSPHFHLLCTFRQNLSFKSVADLFPDVALDGSRRNTFVEQLHDKYGAFRYLTHKDNPEKFQYAESSIISNNLDYYIPDTKVSDNEAFLDKLLSPYVSYRQLAVEFGKDFIRNHKTYLSFAELVHKQEEAIFLGSCARPLIAIPYDSFIIDMQYSFHSFVEELFDTLVADYKYPIVKKRVFSRS